MQSQPWTIHPELTQSRLSELARLFVEIRTGAKHDSAPEKGDDSWVLGSTVYGRTRWAIAGRAANRDDLITRVGSPGTELEFAL